MGTASIDLNTVATYLLVVGVDLDGPVGVSGNDPENFAQVVRVIVDLEIWKLEAVCRGDHDDGVVRGDGTALDEF